MHFNGRTGSFTIEGLENGVEVFIGQLDLELYQDEIDIH